MLIYLNEEPIYPIGYVQHKIPKFKRRKTEYKETNGAELLMRRQPLRGRSIEYADNRISLYFAQKGKCAVTGESFVSTSEIHGHHKIPKSHGGSDEYENLILVTATTPCAVKVACTVWSGGKLGDYFKELPITMRR